MALQGGRGKQKKRGEKSGEKVLDGGLWTENDRRGEGPQRKSPSRRMGGKKAGGRGMDQAEVPEEEPEEEW